MNDTEVRELIANLAKSEGTSWREFAASLGISQPYFWQMASGTRPLSPKLLDAIGLERVTVYRRKVKAS